MESQDLVRNVARIVASYVAGNQIDAKDLPALIHQTYAALATPGTAPSTEAAEPLKPAVPIKKSVTPDYIICLEDGKKFKSLKRHLGSKYDMTPDEYREKWNLPRDYPMVAPNYAKARSELARNMGLGQPRTPLKRAS